MFDILVLAYLAGHYLGICCCMTFSVSFIYMLYNCINSLPRWLSWLRHSAH